MTKEEAWKIIEFNKEFNLQYWPGNMTPEEQAVLLARKRAWANAWEVVGESKTTFTVTEKGRRLNNERE